jgi:glycerophosphoryl diester phosphodiesterase
VTRFGDHGLGRRLQFAMAGFFDPRRCRDGTSPRPLAIVGHRGSPRDRAENTVASFERALELGANAIETDVCLTRDERLVLWHDADPDERIAVLRQAGVEGYAFRPSAPDRGSRWRRPVRDLDEADLRARYGYSRVGEDGSAPMASLAELFDWAENAPGLERILLDTKLAAQDADRAAVLIQIVREAARRPSLRRIDVHVLSPAREVVDAYVVEVRRAGLPENVRLCADFELPGVRRNEIPREVRQVSLGGNERLWPGFRREICAVVDARKQAEFEGVTVWTVNRPSRLRQLLEIGVDGILTDDVAALRSLAPLSRERAS